MKPTFANFKKSLKSCGAHWVSTKDEVICGLLRHRSNEDHVFRTYGLPNGYLETAPDGAYDNFTFTDKGMFLLTKLKQTTCAFTGRTIKQ